MQVIGQPVEHEQRTLLITLSQSMWDVNNSMAGQSINNDYNYHLGQAWMAHQKWGIVKSVDGSTMD